MILYHQTKAENIESILKIGLMPNKIGIVYLSPRNNLNFGDTTLEVETGDNKLTAFDDCKDWEVLCWGKIEPFNIRVLDELKMRINGKKYYDDATLEKAAGLIRKAELTVAEICKELHTSLPTLVRNMNRYFSVIDGEGETNWRKIYKTKYSINRQKKKRTRIAWECAMCGNESKTEIHQCSKCGSYCIRKRELINKLTSIELRTANMIGRRQKKKV